MSNLVLRKVAGEYWLIDISQKTIKYKKPLQINEVGAQIYTLYAKGKSCDDIVDLLSNDYKVEKLALENDVKAFLNKINAYDAQS